MAPHSRTLAWKIPWTEEPGRLQTMGLWRVGNDWATSLSLFTHTLKEMATHSGVLSWRIPGTGEPGGLPSMGSHRVGHNWSDSAAAAAIVGDECLFVCLMAFFMEIFSADFYSCWFPPSSYCVLYWVDLVCKEEGLSLKSCTWLSNTAAWGKLLSFSKSQFSHLWNGVHFINFAGSLWAYTEKTHIMHLESGKCAVNMAFFSPVAPSVKIDSCLVVSDFLQPHGL